MLIAAAALGAAFLLADFATRAAGVRRALDAASALAAGGIFITLLGNATGQYGTATAITVMMITGGLISAKVVSPSPRPTST